METRRYIVHGRVQGVGFRWFVQRQAVALSINGWVKNRMDGSVEVWGEAPQAGLEAFQSLLEEGPAGAYVREVRVEKHSNSGRYRGFDIRF